MCGEQNMMYLKDFIKLALVLGYDNIGFAVFRDIVTGIFGRKERKSLQTKSTQPHTRLENELKGKFARSIQFRQRT